MTNKRLVWYLEKEKKIDDRQLDFRKQKSTKDAISKILNGLRRKEKTVEIFFDMKKVTGTTREYGNTRKNAEIHQRTDW